MPYYRRVCVCVKVCRSGSGQRCSDGKRKQTHGGNDRRVDKDIEMVKGDVL